MNRALAIIERDLRKFFRSPTLLIVTLVLPLVQLVVLGNAFGGNIRNVKLGVVMLDHGPETVPLLRKLDAIAANARTFVPIAYSGQGRAMAALKAGRLGAVLIIPPHYSRNLLLKLNPRVGLIVDNTDRSLSGAVEAAFNNIAQQMNQPFQPARVADLEPPFFRIATVELYPYIPYMQYLLPGSVTLALFVTAMIGGGIVFIDDKSRGLHEGYLVPPITKFELVSGFVASGVVKAIASGLTVLILGGIISGIQNLFDPLRLLFLLLMTVVGALALISMMFLLMARVSDPLVPRAIFGVLNTLLFFPSGAVYPIEGFPPWMRVLARVDPFTYAVHGYRALLLKQVALAPIGRDLLVLCATTALMLAGASWAFKRSL